MVRRLLTGYVMPSRAQSEPIETMTDPDALYLAVHEMLVARLLQGQNSLEFLKAINRVIEVHDEMAGSYTERQHSAALSRLRTMVDAECEAEIATDLARGETPTEILNWLASDELHPGGEPWNIAMDALGRDKEAALEAWWW